MQTDTRIVIENFPVRHESNRERIIRALREADGVVPQCYGSAHGANGAKCAGMAAYDGIGGEGEDGVGGRLTKFGLQRGWGSFLKMNDDEHLTFAQIADRLESDPSYWNEKADLPYEGER